MAEIGSDIPRRVAILRRPDGLHGILSRRNHPFAPPLPITDEVGDLTESGTDADPRVLAALAAAHAGPAVSNPVSRRLREHLQGVRQLRPQQLERDVALLRRNWPAIQLDCLSQLAFDHMSQGLPTAERTPGVRHALMIQQFAEEHRRSLRRLLKAYLVGRRTFADEHPRNLEWLRRHPAVDPAKWRSGVVHGAQVPGLGSLRLSVEQDALEVLRLGSYFGTCLGVGGDFGYSAVAIALDVNKRVVYARNDAGSVAARQLLAISEDDHLICFDVYPRRANCCVRSVFREFDLRLAEHLGLPVYSSSSGEKYEIAATVSCDFWDDGAWDLRTKTD